MLDLFVICAQLAVAAFVFFASIFRLAPMHVAQHKALWIAGYMCMALGAVVSVHDISHGAASWSALLWGTAAALYLIGSRHSWHAGVPRFFAREP